MKNTFRVINRMVDDGVIASYAIAGAVAALNYVEPTLTEDLDVLISIDDPTDRPRSGLVTLEPLFAHLRKAGYRKFKKEGIVIEGWPVQFLPVANDLDAEGLAKAVEVEIEADRAAPPITVRTLRAEHVVATALRVGRPKDRIRIGQFLAEEAVDLAALRNVLDRHHMRKAWSKFCTETGIPDPLGVKSKR
ncbi:MAG: hypothetical protein ACREB6_05455 [Rhodospirillales bacterium]